MPAPSEHTGALAPLWTVDHVAERLNVSTKTIYRLAAAGEIPCVRVRGAVRFDEREIEAYIARGHRVDGAIEGAERTSVG